MGQVTYRDGIAILQVIIYFPSLFAAIALCLRHGFSKSSGWVLLISFSCLRLAGAIAQLVTINSPGNVGAITTAIICDGIGLSPLTLLSLGLLARFNRLIRHPISSFVFRGLSLGSLVGLALGIYGGVHAADTATSYSFTINWYSKAAVLIFTVIYVIAIVIFGLLAVQLPQISGTHEGRGERRLLLAVAISIPFIATRLVYALIADFAQAQTGGKFSVYGGSPTIYLCMAVLEEIVVVVICEAVGFTLKRLPRDDAEARREVGNERAVDRVESGENGNVAYKEGGVAGASVGQSPAAGVGAGAGARIPARKRRRGHGPISWLFALGMNAYDDWQEKKALQARQNEAV